MTTIEAGTTERRGRRPGSVSVTTRLLVLVLVPLVGMTAVVAEGMRERAGTASSATQVAQGVARIQRLVALRSTVGQERFYADWAAGSRALGVDPGRLRVLFGVDVEGRRDELMAATDRLVGDLGEDAEVVTAADMASVRQGIGGTIGSERTLTASYLPIQQRLDEAQARILTGLRPLLDMRGGASVAGGLDAIRSQMDIATSIAGELQSTVLAFIGVGDRARLQRTMVAAETTQTRAFDELQRSGQPWVATSAAALAQEQPTLTFRAAMVAAAAGDQPRYSADASDEARKMADIAIAGIGYSTRTYDLIQRSTTALGDTAGRLEADARNDQLLWTVYTGGIGVLSLGVSLLLAASITRPLRRLRDHAEALSVGDLHVGALAARGPHDIAVTSRAFNDLVDNLRLLEAKTRALAELDFDAEALAAPLPGPLGQALQRSLRTLSGSITERDELRGHILHQASHDDLTGLPNRSAAIEELDQALTRARRVGRGVGVLHVDLDGFKRINDTYGHAFGDAVLTIASRRLDEAAAGSSLLARFGADEFLVLVEDVDDPEAVVALARAVTSALGEPTHIDAVTVATSACVGVGLSLDAGGDRRELLAGADLAVAAAKRRGPGSVEIHDRALQEQLVTQAVTEDALGIALGSDDELFLQYQPVIDLATGHMTSVEALIRWNRPGAGIQPPDSFIPVAERSNLIIDLDRWVLARAARQLRDWHDDPVLGTVDVAVNVSGRHLTHRSLHDHVRELLAVTGVDPRRIIIEVTETALVDDLAIASAQLEATRRLGVRIALDDFGTGYTSIAQLRRLPVDIIKIDQSFVQRIDGEGDRALLRMITEFGHHVGATITAEGVETAEQLELLRDLGCDRAQGYHLSRPINAAALEAWAAARPRPVTPSPRAG